MENANDSLEVSHRTKTTGVWSTKVVHQPQAIATYNQLMNVVDHSVYFGVLMSSRAHYKKEKAHPPILNSPKT